jgi:RimJ/RimL family protein N-acetyltransferase
VTAVIARDLHPIRQKRRAGDPGCRKPPEHLKDFRRFSAGEKWSKIQAKFRSIFINPNAYLCTKRLRLRLLKAEDAADISRLLINDPEAVQRTASMGEPMNEAAARDWIERRTSADQHVFAILLASSGEFIGSIGFGGAREMPYVGYWIGRPHWNQGYATEAVKGLIEYARWLGIPALQADTFPDNPASAHVLTKAGFTHSGRIKMNLPMRGGLRELEHHVIQLKNGVQ